MSFAEIKHDYLWGAVVEGGTALRDQGQVLAGISIDAWETDNDDDGQVVANVLLTRHGDIVVDFHDNRVRMDPQVLEHISEAKAELQKIWTEYAAKHLAPGQYVTERGCTATLQIPCGVMALIERFLHAETENDYQGEDNTITYTVRFPDGKEMDIKCCGCQDEASWTEAVLFDEYGSQLCCSEPDEGFDGPWHLQHNGVDYIVTVVTEKA